ncbi:hypothetical protein PP713_13875 [Mycobacterium sp. CSUR Q5927]|nr:hypothetical protein [Mycobacterium sp. CSUR Q5927]
MSTSYWREKAVPVLWLIATAILIGGALGVNIAHAEPLSPGEKFAHDYAADVCLALDSHPTVAGVVGLLEGLHAYGLSDYEAGVGLATSVIGLCPVHKPLLRQFVTRVQSSRSGVVA